MGERMTYSFGPYALETQPLRLKQGHEVVTLSERLLRVLLALVWHAGDVQSKDALIEAAWHDVAVTDNSLEQAISALRRALGTADGGQPYIETAARRGYRFAAAVTRTTPRHSDESLTALLAPYRALVGGRAALETLDRAAVERACAVVEQIAQTAPDDVTASRRGRRKRAREAAGAAPRGGAHHRDALTHFERELACEPSRHIYGREACTNTWYALAAISVRHHRTDVTFSIFQESLQDIRRRPGSSRAWRCLSWMVGLRTEHGSEFGFGPNITPAGWALALAAGTTFRAGVLNVPVNVAVVPSRDGMRVSFLTGFSLRR